MAAESGNLKVDALVIGAGPGGYVAGIRLGQLKKKAIVIEREKAGGVCLNVGCIPSKALINAAKTYDKMKHADEIGVFAENIRVDMGRMQTWKDTVVSKLTGGVSFKIKPYGLSCTSRIPWAWAKATRRVRNGKSAAVPVGMCG